MAQSLEDFAANSPVSDADADALLAALLAAFPDGDGRWTQIEAEYNRLAATTKSRMQLKNRSKKVVASQPAAPEPQEVRETCILCSKEVPKQSWLGDDFQRLVCCGKQVCVACDGARRKAAEKSGSQPSGREKCFACKEVLPSSTAESLAYVKVHARKGKAWAQHNMGCRYETGKDVEQDYEEAYRWFRQAADQGFALSEHAVGECYKDGQGVQTDFHEAARWYQKSIDQGYEPARKALAELARKTLAEPAPV